MFGELVRAHRQRLGLAQEDLAARTGLSTRTISKIETGRIAAPRPATVRLLAEAFGLAGADRDQFCRSAAGRGTDRAGVPGGTVDAAPAFDLPVPRQLPAVTGHFVGRSRELETLDRLVSSRHTAVVISAIAGTAGIGKTTLALHWAHRVADRFPDGQLYVNLRGYDPSGSPLSPAEALRGFLDALGVPPQRVPTTLEARAALYRSLLADRRMLVVLDNARDAAQVRALLPASPTCLVLVTSRHQVTSLAALEDAHHLTLDLLTPDESRQLLQARLGADRVGAEPQAVERIIAGCARLPLALAVVAARAAVNPGLPLASLADQLSRARSRLDALSCGDTATDVRAVFSWSYDQLGADAARLFRLLSLHPGPEIAAPAVARLAGLPPSRIPTLVSELTEAHLLTEPAPGRYGFHDLLRTYAGELTRRLDPERDRLAATERVLDHYVRAAATAVAVAYPYERDVLPALPAPDVPVADLADPARAGAWLDTELPNLLAAAHHGADHGWPRHTLNLSRILRRHLLVRGLYREAETLSRRALDLARTAGDRSGELTALTTLGRIHLHQGRYELAAEYFQQALAVAGGAGDPRGELEAFNGLGQVHRMQGRYEQAARCLGRALELAAATGDRDGLRYALTGLGHVHGLQGRYEQAAQHFRQALDVARTIGHRQGELTALNGLGQVHRARGRHEQADGYYRQALDIARATGDRVGELYAWHGLGEVDRALGRYGRAADHYRQALGIARETRHRYGQVEALLGLGSVHHATGHPRAALAHLHRALGLAASLGQPAEQARASDRLAHAYRALRRYDRARHHWQRALELLTALGTDHIDDPQTTVATVRAHLAELDRQRVGP
ncbi:MAG: tetratricopeptide repeat protein [Micromonosporaceae bacterium]|jgi:tetratricopeptide (TPR) repeat protein/DNA-binding XRE family transcriptional regulator